MDIDTITQYFSENNVIINSDDIKTLNRYLNMVLEKGGTNNMKVIHYSLNHFFRYIQTTSIQEITTEMIMDYLDMLKANGYKYNTIKCKRLMIGAFLNFYTGIHAKQKFINPMPNKALYQIKKPLLTEDEQEQFFNSKIYTIEELLIILKRAYHLSQGSLNFVTRESFVMIVLAIVTGARESEIASIQIKNLHLNDRYFFTGNIDNANKNHKSITFCFPEEVKNILRVHLMDREQTNKGSEWLFPGLWKFNNTHVQNNQISAYMKGLFRSDEFPKPLVSHSLRRTLTTIRNCPTHIEETLSNHEVTSIIQKHYKLSNWKARRDVYDQYFPTKYTQILEFLRNC